MNTDTGYVELSVYNINININQCFILRFHILYLSFLNIIVRLEVEAVCSAQLFTLRTGGLPRYMISRRRWVNKEIRLSRVRERMNVTRTRKQN